MRRAAISLALVLGSSCSPTGSFCSLYTPIYFNSPVAASVVHGDRQAAEDVYANNAVYEKCRV